MRDGKLIRNLVVRAGWIALMGTHFALADGMSVARDLTLHVIRFDDRREVKFNLLSSRQVGEATMEGKVRFRDGQFWIELKYRKLKPAVLFGGDVTCYVLWAVNRDGAPQNLGELWVRPDSDEDTVRYSTGLRNFALLVTAESYYQVDEPSEMVLFWNDGRPDPPVPTDPLQYSRFAAAPRVGVDTLANVRYDGDKPLELLQAEKVYEQARRLEVEKYAPELFAQATVALEQATHMYRRDRTRGAGEYARRSVAATNEAFRVAVRRRQLDHLVRDVRCGPCTLHGKTHGEDGGHQENGAPLDGTVCLLHRERAKQEDEAGSGEEAT